MTTNLRIHLQALHAGEEAETPHKSKSTSSVRIIVDCLRFNTSEQSEANEDAVTTKTARLLHKDVKFISIVSKEWLKELLMDLKSKYTIPHHIAQLTLTIHG